MLRDLGFTPQRPVRRAAERAMRAGRIDGIVATSALELGVDEYLGKPYQESQLLEAIASQAAVALNWRPQMTLLTNSPAQF